MYRLYLSSDFDKKAYEYAIARILGDGGVIKTLGPGKTMGDELRMKEISLTTAGAAEEHPDEGVVSFSFTKGSSVKKIASEKLIKPQNFNYEELSEKVNQLFSSFDLGQSQFNAVIGDPLNPSIQRNIRFCLKSFLGLKGFSRCLSKEGEGFRVLFKKHVLKKYNDFDERAEQMDRAVLSKYTLTPSGYSDREFDYFLRMIDSHLPEILTVLLGYFLLMGEEKNEISILALAKAVVRSNFSSEITRLGPTKKLRNAALLYKLRKFLYAWIQWNEGVELSDFLTDYQGLIFIDPVGELWLPCPVGKQHIEDFLLRSAYLKSPFISKEEETADGSFVARIASEILFCI